MILWLLEAIGFNVLKAWWNRDKTQEAQDAANKVDSLSDDTVRKRLRLWTRD